jgi:hypothetical protein
MQYMLTLYVDEMRFEGMTPQQQQEGYGAYMAYIEALKQAGAHVASGRLRPVATASTVRVKDGKAQILDGPFLESKEQLGGYFLIDVADQDAAIAWAARCPAAGHGTVEVRALWAM